jgi:hypothetical protein
VGFENDESGKLVIMQVESSHGEKFLWGKVILNGVEK